MADLIPIGTINRTAAENNQVKSSKDVQRPAEAKAIDDVRVSGGNERRRRVDRRRHNDRRRRARGLKERRVMEDRRGSPRTAAPAERRASRGNQGRKGRIIDERV